MSKKLFGLTVTEQAALRYAFLNKPTGLFIYSPTGNAKAMVRKLTEKGLMYRTKFGQNGLTAAAIELRSKLLEIQPRYMPA